MKLTNLQRYTPDELHMGEGIQYFKDDSGKDWFTSLSEFTKKYVLAIDESTGVICSITTEASKLYPVGLSVVDVDTLPEGVDNDSLGMWVFDGEDVVARTYSKTELQDKAKKKLVKLLADANENISIWKIELHLGIISDAEKQKLIKWVDYIKILRGLDTSIAPDIEWPIAPEI